MRRGVDDAPLRAYALAYVRSKRSNMNAMRHVRLFRNGRNQAVRIPRDMELDADEAILRRDGDRLILEPVPATPLLALLATLNPSTMSFPTSMRIFRRLVTCGCDPFTYEGTALPAGHQHRVGSGAASTGYGRGAYRVGRRAAGLHQHHRRGGIAFRRRKERVAQAAHAGGCRPVRDVRSAAGCIRGRSLRRHPAQARTSR